MRIIKSRHGRAIKRSGAAEYVFTRDWSFARKGKRIYLAPRSILTRNLLKKGIIRKVVHR